MKYLKREIRHPLKSSPWPRARFPSQTRLFKRPCTPSCRREPRRPDGSKGCGPLSLLLAGTPSEVEDYCKNLIREAGRDGGFILTTAAGMTGSKPANVRAMIEYAKKAGVYPLAC